MNLTKILALVVGCLLCESGPAHAAIIFDNLANSAQGFGSVTPTIWEAQRFNSDSTNLSLDSVTLRLDSESGGSGTFFLRLFSDAAGQPGAALATLFSGPNALPGPFPESGDVVFGGLTQTLAPNTNYWLVLGENSGAALDLRWGSTSTLTGTGSGFQITNAQTADQGGTWGVSSSSAHIAQITASPAAASSGVPEPSSAICFMLVAAALVPGRFRRIR